MPLVTFLPPEAVIFDVDGTLLDTAPDLCGTLNALLAEHGRTPMPLDRLRPMIGDGAAKMVERGFAASGSVPVDFAGLVRRFIEIYEGRIADETQPFPGVVACLDRLRAAGMRLGVCTNKTTRLTDTLLQALGLTPYFAAVVGGDGPARKPDPRHILAVTERLGVQPARAVMIGDSINDVAAAKAADIRVVAVTFGYTVTPASELGADALVDHFDELPRLLGLG
jgi:phosphoglycolate phosphatase